jgi:hypothetical protein
MQKTRGGFALMTVLLFVTVLAIMVGALLLAARQDTFVSMGYSQDVAAGLVAEAGVADVLDQLMDDPSFATDLIDQPVEGRSGTYTVTWKDPADAGPSDSVNNFGSDTPVDGPRGADTVPQRSAEIVVTATVGNTTHVTQLVVLGAPGPSDASPLAATGNIYLRGNMNVDSVDNLLDGYVSGGKTVHSNSRPGTVQWTKETPSDQARFDGDVTCSCSQLTAVNLQGSQGSDYFVENEQRAVPTISLPSIDVKRAVADQTSYPSPTFNFSGVSTLPAGNYFASSNVNLPDDLVLEDGVNLFIDGDLRISGTVRGQGKIMVDGKVDIYGDTFIAGGEDNFVSLLSSKNLTVSGYQGDDRLAQLSGADPALDDQLNQMNSALSDLNAALAAGDSAQAQSARSSLGEGAGSQLLQQIKTQVSADPANDLTTRFLERKLDRLSDLFGDYELVTGSGSIMSDSLDGTDTTGMVDFALRRSDSDLRKTTQTLLGQLSRKELGYSHFRGMLYSNGRLQVQDGVGILGLALADDGNGGGTFDNYLVPVDGQTYQPSGRISGANGSIVMEGGTRLTLDRSLMQGGGGGGGGRIRIASWLRR